MLLTAHTLRTSPQSSLTPHSARLALPQVLLTAPLARWSGQSVRNRNLLLLGGFAMMVGADACFGLPMLANTGGE